MHDNQLYEDVQAKHEFLMQNVADWRRTRNVSVRTGQPASAIQQLRLVFTTLLSIFTK